MPSDGNTQKSAIRLKEIARGGMGMVELVLRQEGDFRRLFAVKRLLPTHRDDAEFRRMFLDEGRVAGLLRHPNIVSVIDVGEDDDGPFLLMDYIEGLSVSQLVREARRRGAPMPIQVCLRICQGIARGLHCAHELRSMDGAQLNLVHRDVTPQNVLVSFDGQVLVADFGIAKVLGQATKTSTGVLKGKLGYMSPEQLRFREPDRRSDLFALGVVLFELLSGTRAYAGDGLEPARRILEEPPPDILEHREGVHPGIVELLFDLMSKDPDERPASTKEVAARIESALAVVLLDEDPISVHDYLEEHHEGARIACQQMLDDLVSEATSRVLPAPPTPEVAPSATGRGRKRAIVAAAVAVAGAVAIAAYTMTPAAPEQTEEVTTPIRPVAGAPTPQPVEVIPAAAQRIEEPAQAEPPREPESEPAAEMRAPATMRRRSSAMAQEMIESMQEAPTKMGARFNETIWRDF